MQIEQIELEVSRVERITRVYDSQSRIVQEQIEFFLPKDSKHQPIGFTKTKSLKPAV